MRLVLVSLVILLASCSRGDRGTETVSQTASAVTESLTVNTVEIRTHVYAAAEAAEPLPVGSLVPAVPVTTIDGEPANLAAVVNAGALLVFYRGGW